MKEPSLVEYLISTREDAISIVTRTEQWLKGAGCLKRDTVFGSLRMEHVVELIKKEKEGGGE